MVKNMEATMENITNNKYIVPAQQKQEKRYEMNKEYDDEIEIDLGALFQCLLKKWWLIVICALIGAGLALGSTILLITPKYQSSAMLYILNKTTSVTSLADIQIGSALTADFEVIATSKPVIDGAIETLKKEYEKLEKSIKKPKDEKTIDELIDENRLANKTIKGF